MKEKGILHNKKGLTLIELVLVMALLLVTLGLGYNLYFYAQKGFKDSEERWIKQTAAKQLAENIDGIIHNSYEADIYTNVPASFSSDYSYIYQTSDGMVYFKNYTSPSAVQLSSEAFSISFSKAKDKNGAELNNTVAYSITTSAVNYQIDSSVFLPNMPAVNKINSDSNSKASGSVLRFKTSNSILIPTAPKVNLSGFCFVATAAYGSYEQPSVKLLRQFRDQYLLTNSVGREFVKLYYTYSPPLADFIAQHKELKAVTRIALLPLIGIAAMLIGFPIQSIIMFQLLIVMWFYGKKEKSLI